MDPWTWIAIAAVILIAAVVLVDAYRRHAARANAHGDDERQLREARRWQDIESQRARDAANRSAEGRN